MGLDLPFAQLAATVALNLSMAAVVGASMSSWWLRAAASPWASRHLAGLRTTTLAATAVAVIAYMLVLWLEAASMAEVPLSEAAPAVVAVLTATHYGVAWTIGACSLAVIIVSTAVQPTRTQVPAAALVRLLAIGSFLYSRSIVSHAGAGGDLSLAVAADWLHLVFISLWIGEVLIAALITLRATSESVQESRLDRAQYVQALSNSATVALAGIVGTGLFSAWRGLGSPENITGNPYADALQVKLVIVAGAALLGGVNRFLVMPGLLSQLRTNGGNASNVERRFTGILQFEAVLLVLALAMAAVLSSTSPPTAG